MHGNFTTVKREDGAINRQWAAKMEAVGLMPSSTGRAGGKRTGEKMSDYPIEGGDFLSAFNQLLTDKRFLISWFDRFPAHQTAAEIQTLLSDEQLNHLEEIGIQLQKEDDVKPTRYKYRCQCGCHVWGKRDWISPATCVTAILNPVRATPVAECDGYLS